MSQWIVLLDGENVWQENDKPMTFATEQDAWDEIDQYYRDCEEAVSSGYMVDVDYDLNFRVVEVV